MDILISGASTGIGRACAVHLARLGHTVWCGVRSQKSNADILSLNVKGLVPIVLDVGSESSMTEALSRVRKESGTLHALVNNAGIAIGGPCEGVPIETWRRQFEVNFFGAVRLTQLCLPLIRESKGRLVNMSSISGRVAGPFLGPYSSSKFALEAFSDSLRREVSEFGVRVSVIEPGPIATPIWKKSNSEGLDLLNQMPVGAKEIYESKLNRFRVRFLETAEKAEPVHLVVKAVAHALLAKSPLSRYPVGRGISQRIALAKWLGDDVMDWLIRKKFS